MRYPPFFPGSLKIENKPNGKKNPRRGGSFKMAATDEALESLLSDFDEIHNVLTTFNLHLVIFFFGSNRFTAYHNLNFIIVLRRISARGSLRFNLFNQAANPKSKSEKRLNSPPTLSNQVCIMIKSNITFNLLYSPHIRR